MIQICICIGSSCHLKGSYMIIKIFEELIKLNKLEDKVNFMASFCLGRCTKGVSVKVDDQFIEDLTIDNAKERFQEYVIEKVIV
jgi:NADH:ubiquinone oxidoreductase subunit E